jgi:Tol biopolymer transport system component
MLTRRKAFDADNPASVIGAVLERDPPAVTSERQDLPAAIDRVLGRCLAKSPDARWQSAADLASELRWLREAPASTAPTTGASRSRSRAYAAILAAVVSAVGIVALTTYRFADRERASPPIYRFPVGPPEDTRYVGLFAIAPDGQHLVFTAVDAAGVNALWLRPLDALASERLAGTQGANYPFWSPDGRSVGFFADRKLKILDIASGVVRVLCDAGRGGGGTWNANDVIVFAPESAVLSPTGLMRIAASGGTPAPITTFPDASQGLHSWPRFLPDGRHYLYSRIVLTNDATRPLQSMAIYVGALDDSEMKKVADARRATYANGDLFWVNEGRLMVQRFDVNRLELIGEPRQIAEDIEQTAPGRAAFDVSPNGVLAYRTGRPRANQLAQLTWFDRTGREVGRIGEPAAYSTAVLSPDARYALAVRGGHVLRIDVGNGTATPLPERDASSPVWNSDGTRVAFTGGVAGRGPTSVSIRAVDGSGPSEMVLPVLEQVYPSDWSSDGQFIVGSVIRADTGYDLFTTRVGSHAAAYPVASASDETDAHLSPDMRWIAYAATDESRRWDVYVRPFGASGGLWRVSRSGGRHPRWRRDGRELFYVTPEGALMSASLSTGSSFRVTESRTLFRQPALALDFNNPLASSRYDVSRDGGHFLVRMPAESGLPEPIVVLLNWTSPFQH